MRKGPYEWRCGQFVARTAIGSFGRSLVGVAPSELGATAAGAAIERAEIEAARVEQVVCGNVIHTVPEDMYLGRVVGIRAGVPVCGVEPKTMGIGPVPAIRKALERAGKTLDDVDVIELNEALAAQSLAVLKDLGLEEDGRVNPNGGAIALGHPIAPSGGILVTKLLHEMDRED